MYHKKVEPSIIITIGPSLKNKMILKEILSMNVTWVRFNMSHGTHEEHKEYRALVQTVANELGRDIKCFADLQGPKIRVGKLLNEPLELLEGTLITITSKGVTGTSEKISVDHPEIQSLLDVGSTIFLHDGAIKLAVLSKESEGLLCKVTQGGALKSHQGVNIPDALLPFNAITKKDADDLTFAINELNVDGIALSFVRTKEDIFKLQELIDTQQHKKIIISKIETKLALHHIQEIIENSDILMLARGDLGIEIPATKIPLTQKEICLIGNDHATPIIIATQILTSMIHNEVPTRAEITDAIDGLIDGATYLMLSDETTVGNHPVQAVRILDDSIKEFLSKPGVYGLFENGRPRKK